MSNVKSVNTYAGDLRLVGGRLCLDFVNTVNDHTLEHPREHWCDYGLFLTWARHASALTPAELEEAQAVSSVHPRAAEEALEFARRVRRALYGLFSAAAHGRPCAQSDLETFNTALARVPHPLRLAAGSGGLRWGWPEGINPLERPIWAAIYSAATLLVASELALVHECEGPGCSWLFLDTSRNHSRRWCSMEDCGNLAKARRYYARRH